MKLWLKLACFALIFLFVVQLWSHQRSSNELAQRLENILLKIDGANALEMDSRLKLASLLGEVEALKAVVESMKTGKKKSGSSAVEPVKFDDAQFQDRENKFERNAAAPQLASKPLEYPAFEIPYPKWLDTLSAASQPEFLLAIPKLPGVCGADDSRGMVKFCGSAVTTGKLLTVNRGGLCRPLPADCGCGATCSATLEEKMLIHNRACRQSKELINRPTILYTGAHSTSSALVMVETLPRLQALISLLGLKPEEVVLATETEDMMPWANFFNFHETLRVGDNHLVADTVYGGCNIPPYHPSFSQAMQARLEVKPTIDTQTCLLGTNQTLAEILKNLLQEAGTELNIVPVDHSPAALKVTENKLSKCRLLLMEGDTQGMNLLAPPNTVVAEIGDGSQDHAYHGWLQSGMLGQRYHRLRTADVSPPNLRALLDAALK